jgi:dipeptidyl aminopeptidase/acylaminoacyl peptidase
MSAVLTIALVFAAPALAQQDPRPMDHDVYDSWNDIEDERVSDDGRWIVYSLVPQDGDAELLVRAVQSSTEHVVPRGRGARFSPDGRFVVFRIAPELALQRQAQRDDVPSDQQPKDSLGILDLQSGTVTRFERVRSFAVPEDAGAYVAFLLEKGAERDTTDASDPEEAAREPEEQEEKEEDEGEESEDKEDGTTLVLRSLVSGQEHRFDFVTGYRFADNGRRLAYTASSKDGTADGAYVVATSDGSSGALMVGEGHYKGIVFDDAGERIAFLSDRDDYDADQPAYTLYHHTGSGDARALAAQGAAGIPNAWWVSEHGELDYSDNGARLFFGTAPRPAPEPEEETPTWEKVELDVWNWKDPLLQPMQLVRRDEEMERTYLAVVHLDNTNVVQLADEAMPEVTVGADGDADVALGVSNVPYLQRISWDQPGYQDVYVVNVETGERRMIREALQGSARLSPSAKYVTWWDGHERTWYGASVDSGEPVDITARVPHPLWEELHDWPMLPDPYGSAGWTEDDSRFLVYDRHDIWAIDPSGREAPRNITEGVGRQRNLEFRTVDLDPDEDAIAAADPMLLRTFDRTTKNSGFYRDMVRGGDRPRELVMEERAFGYPRKAEDADVVMLTRETFRDYPNLYTTNLSFGNMQRMSDANPQQSQYRWGTAEIVNWRSIDGVDLQGILYKPDDFDPNRQYPMMVYFYEKMSDGLHQFRDPGPGSSSISVSFFVSRGYVVFIPDIHYQVGYPGESALDCVVSGVLSVLEKGFVDPERVGVQGHSWGGYQIAYMVTQSDIFAAAEAGAPVSNMTSAYGGIRWGTGMSRMFQYERSQSRIGGTLWEARPQYIANSPLFWADKINTPVLMMHNDEDTAVPWYQGIEFFVALRRLDKPVWMLNYNGEPHGLRKYQNQKDFQIRMQQFFDHYLTGAAAPVWLEEGVPAVDKGRSLGLELVEEAQATGGSGRDRP